MAGALMGLLVVLVLCRSSCAAAGQEGTFTKIKEVDITPLGRRGGRPDVVGIGGKLYVAYRDATSGGFGLITLNENLEVLGSTVDLFSDTEGGNRATDIRMAKDEKGRLWYAFESARIGERMPTTCDSNFLNAAMYNVSGANPELVVSKVRLALGCPTGLGGGMMFMLSGVMNREAVDDPTPFFHNGKYYILTRSGLGSLQHIRSYNGKFDLLEDFTLDLSPFIGSNSFSQNVLAEIDNHVYLIGSVDNGPPVRRESVAVVYAIPLSDDLKSVTGTLTPLVNSRDEYPTYVVSAATADNKLYLTYLDRWHENTVAYLEAFDTSGSKLQSLGRVRISSGIADNHVTIQVISGKIYVFQQDTRGRLLAEVFTWKPAGSR